MTERFPKLVLDGDAVETLLALPSPVRKRLLTALDRLRQQLPRETEDFYETDTTGRHISVKAVRPVMIRYWLDSAADEFRVIRISSIKPWIG